MITLDSTSLLRKIDNQAVLGLSGTANSLSYKVAEIEEHIHSRERWLGAAVTPSGETHTADAIGTSKAAFQLDAGNDTWGEWVQILGSSDTPQITGSVYFDPHLIIITAIERVNAIYFVQYGQGSSGADVLTNGAYSDIVIQLTATTPRAFLAPIQSRRVAVGTKVWARTMCVLQNTATINFFVGIHEYDG